MSIHETTKFERVIWPSKGLIKDMQNHLGFATDEDCRNALHHRVMSIPAIQRASGNTVSDDYIICHVYETVLTRLAWFTGYTRSDGRMLVLTLSPSGEYHEHHWEAHCATLSLSILYEATLPMFTRVDVAYGHVNHRLRQRGGRHSDVNQVVSLVEHYRDTNTLVTRTVHNNTIAYLIPIPSANAIAAATYDVETKTLFVATVLSVKMAQRHGYTVNPKMKGWS